MTENNQEIEQKSSNYSPNESQQKYHFTCGICDQQKYSKLHLERVNGLGLDPYKLYRICDYCINRANIVKTKPEPRY
ncbi:MAG: hypothetical protein GBAus27B_000430 [Mycoplasmataceae bacterium]|nr:MAG: hypothetical protein GBAus27B_000430 [Mycoplasmataceae bacterium]